MANIRNARETDADIISELLDQLGHPSSIEHIRRQIRRTLLNKREFVLLALNEVEAVMGILVLQIAGQFHEEPAVARILDLCVLDSHRGKTYGGQLLSEAENIARRYGCFRLEVTSNILRLKAHRFYSAMGMDQTHLFFSKRL